MSCETSSCEKKGAFMHYNRAMGATTEKVCIIVKGEPQIWSRTDFFSLLASLARSLQMLACTNRMGGGDCTHDVPCDPAILSFYNRCRSGSAVPAGRSRHTLVSRAQGESQLSPRLQPQTPALAFRVLLPGCLKAWRRTKNLFTWATNLTSYQGDNE